MSKKDHDSALTEAFLSDRARWFNVAEYKHLRDCLRDALSAIREAQIAAGTNRPSLAWKQRLKAIEERIENGLDPDDQETLRNDA